MERRYHLQSSGFTLAEVAARVAKELGMRPEDVWATGKYRHLVEARSLLCYWAVRELGVSMASLARKLEISVTAVSKSVIRGEKMARARGYSLIEK
jgi:chromosomal replication initiation ATPase DnaA